MALVLKDRVKESSSSSGTGGITLGGAVPGYQTFNAAIANSSTVYYCIHNLAAGYDTEWEVGLGTFTAPTTLARTTILSSSTGSAVNFTAGTNGLEVFVTQPAEQALYTNQVTGLVESSGNGSNSISFTAVTSNLFTGNASALTTINASNISSGTINNARTTASDANGASTIVSRDASGNFTANAGTFTSISGNGVALTAINASNIASGTIANARTTASSSNGASTIVLRGTSGEFAAGVITADGSGLSAINGSNVTTGTVANARTTAATANGASTIVLRDASGNFAAGAITGTSFSGNGSAITAINAASISTGTVATARLGSGTASASTFLRGDSTFATVPSPNNGTLTMNVSGTGLSGSASFTADQAGASTFTVTSNGNSANGASTLVARDASGNFSAGTITAALSGTATTATTANALNSGNSYNVVNLTASGTVTAATVTATSDERLKENWTDVAHDFLSKLAQVKHGVFTRKSSGNREPGVSAQSLQTVILEAVIEDADGFLSVNYGGAALVAAIELAKVVEELRTEIAELKAR